MTHSTMKLSWDAAPGEVSRYVITYKAEDGELSEVRLRASVHVPCSSDMHVRNGKPWSLRFFNTFFFLGFLG